MNLCACSKKLATICYSVKASSNLSILKVFNSLGSGFDIVSEGELDRIIKIGANPKKVVFSGVAKSDLEIRKALDFGLCFFNVESFDELVAINRVSKDVGVNAKISIRVNPDIDPKTQPYISTVLKTSKFVIAIEVVLFIVLRARSITKIINHRPLEFI